MLRLSVLPLFILLCTPLTVAAASKGKGKGDGLTTKEITDVIQSHNDDARACYEEALSKDKAAAGKVKIRFLIGLNGKVEASDLELNTFKDKGVYTCLKTKMKAWSFPKPRGDERVSIAYPFEFKTASAPVAPPAPAAPVSPEAPATPGGAATPEAPQAPTEPTPPNP